MTVEATSGSGTGYPARLEIDYPERLSRPKTLFRLILVLPIGILAAMVAGGYGEIASLSESNDVIVAFGGLLFVPTIFMLLFRRKYPRWWFDWHLELSRFVTRVAAYLGVMRDEYPSTDERQAVHLELDYPDAARDLNRWMPLVKWLLAVPHYIVLAFLGVAAVVVTVIAWFAILFTERYPRGMFDFVVGVHRWGLRVEAYAWLLITDRYPPFSLRA